LNNQELQKLVQQISLKSFSKPFQHKAYFNQRLRTTGGRYHLSSHNIDINPKMLSEHSIDVLIGIIKHELCHYHLHLAGYSGKHNTIAFKKMLQSTGGLRYAPTLKENNSKYWVYVCIHCQHQYIRRRRININKYACGKCHGKLRLRS
jgi:SprT-like protein